WRRCRREPRCRCFPPATSSRRATTTCRRCATGISPVPAAGSSRRTRPAWRTCVSTPAAADVLPPRWVRRLVLAPAMVALAVLMVTTAPLWLVVAAALSPVVPGRLRPLRVLWVAMVHLALEAAILLALGWLWVVGGFGLLVRTPPFQRRHYALVRWYLQTMYWQATRTLRVSVRVEGPEPDDYFGRPLLVFCRHAGPGDSFLLTHALVN